jgi:leucyl aminopeptidase
MAVEFIEDKPRNARPVYLAAKDALAAASLDAAALAWATANDFNGQADRVLVLPGEGGAIAGALLGTGAEDGGYASLATGTLSRKLPEGDWFFATAPADPNQAAIGLALGGYAFTRYGKKPGKAVRFTLPEAADRARIERIVEGVFLTRDLVNTPTNDMGPEALEAAVRALGNQHEAQVSVVHGDALLEGNFPMIHAVGRASAEAPRLIDLSWGAASAPKVTLVGKGVCFDTGGLDIKPASSMLLMKKDMGGAANVLGLR